VLPPLVDLLYRKAVLWIRPLKTQTLPAISAEMNRFPALARPVVPIFLVPTRTRSHLKLLEPLLFVLALPTIRRAFTVLVPMELELLVLADFLWRGKLL